MRGFALIAVWLALLSIVGSASGAAQTGGNRVLHIGLREDPDLLDPTLGSSYVGRIVFAGMCDKLFDINVKLEIIPQLATGYEFKDPTHLEIHLRPNVQFQDGEPFDAEAVKYTLLRDLTEKGSMRAGDISTVRSIDVIDPYTVMLTLKNPDGTLLAQLTDRAGIMLAPKVVEAEGRNFGLHPVCAGPFAFQERVPQDRIVLRRFPGYWNADTIHLDEVIYQPIANSAVRLADLKAGSLDLVEYIVPSDVPAVQRDPKLNLVVGDALGYAAIWVNVGHGPAANTTLGQSALVRRAFELSIDRTALLQVVYNGMYTPVAQGVPPTSPFYLQSVQPPPRDVAKARELLRQAGVPLPVRVVLTVPNSPDLEQATEVIQAMTKVAGFDVQISAMEFASSLQAARSGAFQAYLVYFSGRVDIDGNIGPYLHTGGEGNWGGYSNPLVDKLLDQARTELDTGKRRQLYEELWHQER